MDANHKVPLKEYLLFRRLCRSFTEVAEEFFILGYRKLLLKVLTLPHGINSADVYFEGQILENFLLHLFFVFETLVTEVNIFTESE